MNIYEFVMQREKESEQYYRSLAQKTDHAGLQTILNLLADEEAKHFAAVKHLMENDDAPEMRDSTTLTEARRLFKQMKKDNQLQAGGIDEEDLVQMAVEREDEAEKYYREKAELETLPDRKALLLRIADEEGNHKELAENILELIQKPSMWLEDAEWYHLEEY